MLALEDIKILDLTRSGPGPFCTWILGDLGSEVVKIEAPPTMGGRQAGVAPLPVDESERRESAYQALNRNKKSIGLNLKSEESRRIFYQLAEKADVIVEGFRPGVVERLGIDYKTIAKMNPRIIYCAITGYGQDGPYRDLPGHDINYIAIGGALDLIGNSDGPPIIPLNLLADYGGGGMSAVIGILSAIIARNKTGKGQYTDISLTDSVMSLLVTFISRYLQSNIVPKRGGIWAGGAYPYMNIYETKDGKYITIGCLEPWLWENLCRAIGKEEFIPFYFKEEHFIQSPKESKWQEVSAELKQVFCSRTRDEWFEFLSQKDVPVGKVYSLDEVFSDPQVLHRQMIIEVDYPVGGKIKQVGTAIKLLDTPGSVRSLPPMLGEHTDEVLTQLGYNKERLNELREAGAIY